MEWFKPGRFCVPLVHVHGRSQHSPISTKSGKCTTPSVDITSLEKAVPQTSLELKCFVHVLIAI